MAVSARACVRLTATAYVALYEIEGDNLQAVLDNMIANAGKLHMSDALQLDPAPIPRLLATTIRLPLELLVVCLRFDVVGVCCQRCPRDRR